MRPYYEIMKEIREKNELTQGAVAKVIGTTQQVYSRYENGENEMPIRHLITLAQHYKVSADYLLGLKEKPKD